MDEKYFIAVFAIRFHLIANINEMLTTQAYRPVTAVLQIRKLGKDHPEGGALARLALHSDGPTVFFDNAARQGQPNAHTLMILRKAAAVKALEDVRQILWVNAGAVVFNRNSDHQWSLFAQHLD